MEWKKVIESSYVQLCMIFVVVVLLKELHVLPFAILNYKLFAYILPIFSIPALLNLKKEEEERAKERKISPYIPVILLTLFLFAFGMRLVPYAHNNVPLGYDPGFYKHTIELYVNGLPNIPEGTLPEWVRSMNVQGLFVLTDVMHIFGDINSMYLFMCFFPFLCAFLIFPIFVLTRDFFNERVALMASILYAISYTQYTAFTFLYFKHIIGLMFLLMAIYALERKKYVLLILMYAALGIYHRPEFLLFSLILIPYFIKNRDKKVVFATVATAILIAPFWLPRLDVNLLMLGGTFETAISNIKMGQAIGGGTFFDFARYEWVSLAYLPFALIGAIYLFMKKKWNSLFFYFTINFAIVVFQLFFFRRFIISLDLLFVILAAVGLNYSFLESKKVPKVLGIIAIILLCVSSGILVVNQASHVKPLINENQLEAIQWISSDTEPGAYVLATSYDAPWVLGWSNRRVIAPGLFQWDKHNKSEWIEFLRTDDLNTTERFLGRYEPPIYIYYSKNRGNYLNLKKFENEHFEKVYDDRAIVYRYGGGGRI